MIASGTTPTLQCVHPCVSSDKSAAEKRRQLIQESKFLGGDMEHTHLVKGLDFALLQKVSQLVAAMPILQLTDLAWSISLWINVCFRWELKSPVRRKKRKTWWRKSKKRQSMRVDMKSAHQLLVCQQTLTQIFLCFRKDVDPEEKIEFKTRMGESTTPPFVLL